MKEQTGNVYENKGQGKKVEELRVESQEVEWGSNVDRSPGVRLSTLDFRLSILDSGLSTADGRLTAES
jgi:hypothetical protein